MENNIKKLLATTLELEGLLLMAQQRGNSAPAELSHLIAEKIRTLSNAICAEPTVAPANEAVVEPVSITPPEPVKQPVETIEEPATVSETAEPIEEPKPAMEETVEETKVEVQAPAVPEPMQRVAPESVGDTLGQSQVKLEDKLAKANARDINKAFTLNDRFRFRRELFRNVQADFDSTLDVIATMASFEEAEEYFYDDLCWDPENEDVKLFMEIVSKHF